MTLNKVIREFYINENIKYDFQDSPLTKIKNDLFEYCSPQNKLTSTLDIPSIPGGKLVFCESVEVIGHNEGKHSNPRIDFYYLKGSNKEDLNKVREIIKKHGLENKF